MKKIKIYQRGASDVELLDDSDEAIESYCQELSKVFQMSNVVILKTSTTTFVGRPSQITGLLVEDTESKIQQAIETAVVEETKIEEKPPEPQVDIITDMD